MTPSLAPGQLTFDTYADPPSRSQSPAFTRVQVGMYRKHPNEAALLEAVALRLAAERGDRGFVASEVLDEAGGRAAFPRNLIGSVVGRLRARHVLCVMAREKGRSPKGKGRWVSRFRLNHEAMVVPP